MTRIVPPLRLGVNVDHVATVRNARGGLLPDPVRAAQLACAAGADSITAHLREDRRHIRDDDMRRLKDVLLVPLNFEMAATDEMVALAIDLAPQACCLVPERREERTTEGGLDVLGGGIDLARKVERLSAVGIRVSLFVAPEEDQIARAADIGAAVVELHTGAWCEFVAEGETAKAEAEFARLARAARRGAALGLEIHAGHGLDCATAGIIAALEPVRELNIGHFLIGEAIFAGLEGAIRQMRHAMAQGRAAIGTGTAA
ncbi:pyridoxine 5-phosphate synthase [Angulomicrobium tetraedrale]|uniref:Pyridoxine 5'-phosphate synthase n=1 Tax=Ancylobacter tetraedralis TaxID=217068 RepID=A0A839ZDS6_9HYPH|nr:pyridoxine 5'-phosphate synthase [Ancylobacter tetraedralis]MBB3772953.1 pyridoxine 5-phosphate synthase [Ancylobacter tetraedralis]